MPNDITVETLQQLLRLEQGTGRLYWRERGIEMFRDTPKKTAASECARWNNRFASREAFANTSKRGYRYGRVLNRFLQAHRVVFAIANGRWPNGDVDHRDGDPGNNAPDNLREATRQENLRNAGARRASSSRFKGVHWQHRQKKWCAQCVDASGRKRHLGFFDDEAAAARAYDGIAREVHGDFARLNFPEEIA